MMTLWIGESFAGLWARNASVALDRCYPVARSIPTLLILTTASRARCTNSFADDCQSKHAMSGIGYDIKVRGQ